MTESMTPGERVRAAVKGEAVDRVPICFWHHFKPEGSGERMAQLTYEFFVEKFHLDIVKIMPDLQYPAPQPAVTRAEEWANLPRLGIDTPIFQQQLVCIRQLRSMIGPDYPLILTMFSPLTMTFRFNGKAQALQHLHENPQAFEQGLRTLAENERGIVQAAIEAGVDGIFFSCMGATNKDMTPDEYERYGRPYDLQVLENAQGGWLNIVHVHADPNQEGDTLYFEKFVDYPVAVMSWSDRLTGPTLEDAFHMTNKALMAGLWERGPLTQGSETELENEMLSAIAQTKGRRLILANGCSVPDDVDEQWLHVARRLVDNLH
ncbi:MAG TPA: uroporphyrinogen decarboxylase family protein [Ktedonobacteraceae bacterium]|nr:uroporphyrinogen decarboxylase family protein [Ktedonobacteraceae bacterium]